MANAGGGSGGLGLLFSNLEKFSGNSDLVAWLRQFERCCVVANKTEEPIKGQLLMLCVTGQAKAILENYEEEQGAVQSFTPLKNELDKNYNTTATKEAKMKEFECRSQNVDETEEEFMFALYNLYKQANPDQAAAVQLTAVKRKFLQGIDPEIRRNIFVFCNDPYGAVITRDNLVEYSQKAKVYLSASPTSTYAHGSTASENTVVKSEYENVVSTLEKLNTRMESLENSISGNTEPINAVSDGFRGGYRRGNRGFRGRNRGGRYNNNWSRSRGNRGGRGRGISDNASNSNNSNSPICFKCGLPNHHSRFCLSEN